MFKIQTLNTISAAGLNQFPRELYEIASEMHLPDAILVRSQSMHDMPIADTVRVIGRAGAGLNNIPIAELTERGIPVFNTPGANANAVCELVIAGMLLASRNICHAWRYVNELEADDQLHHVIEQNKKKFVGFELMGKTIGIIGLGNIGVRVANAALSLGMDVIGHDPDITINRAWELSSQVKKAENIDEVLMKADFISFHVPLTDKTKSMINHSRLHLMKKGVVILNFARDGIIDHISLIQALNEKKILAYVTDFPVEVLRTHPNVINLPHLGASTKEAEENCAIMLAKQVRKFFETGTIQNAVNFPQVDLLPNNAGSRIAIVNANIPNMVAQISSSLANVGLNIISLINKSRDNIAYTVIDLDQTVNTSILATIGHIEGIKQLRLIPS